MKDPLDRENDERNDRVIFLYQKEELIKKNLTLAELFKHYLSKLIFVEV